MFKEGTRVKLKKGKGGCVGCKELIKLSNSPTLNPHTVYTSAGTVLYIIPGTNVYDKFLTLKEMPKGVYCLGAFRPVDELEAGAEDYINEINKSPIPKTEELVTL